MSLSPDQTARAMLVIVQDYQRKFTEALGLSAKRGGFKGDMSAMVGRLAMWQRSDNRDFRTWATLTQEAGEMWIQWYDWYSRMDQRLERAS